VFGYWQDINNRIFPGQPFVTVHNMIAHWYIARACCRFPKGAPALISTAARVKAVKVPVFYGNSGNTRRCSTRAQSTSKTTSWCVLAAALSSNRASSPSKKVDQQIPDKPHSPLHESHSCPLGCAGL
jgi:hypothetical protein